MFGMRGEPSAESLAGSGPTVTYPAPPSSGLTPEAIASVAGGTASPTVKISSVANAKPTTAQAAGFDVSPGYATQATNMSAAQANGIYSGGNATKPSTFDGPSAETPKASSYAFGAKAITPKSDSAGALPTSYSLPSNAGIASPTAPVTTPSTTSSFVPPPMDRTAAALPSMSPTQGFTLPTDSPSFSAITPPPTAPAASSITPTNESTTIANIMPPTTVSSADAGPAAAEAPSFSTASAATGYTAPSPTTSVLPASLGSADLSSGSLAPVGYMPGSTSGSSGYPTSKTTPTTNGSYFR
jgi:hypothetical protein